MFDTLTRKTYLVLPVFGVRLGECLRQRELFGSRGRLLTCFLFVLRGLRALLLLLFFGRRLASSVFVLLERILFRLLRGSLLLLSFFPTLKNASPSSSVVLETST